MSIDYAFYNAVIVLAAYFMFLAGIMYMSRNVERVANHRMVEAIVDKVCNGYDLRKLPRVNYKEVSSDEDEYMSAQDEEPSPLRHRDRNPIGRILEVD